MQYGIILTGGQLHEQVALAQAAEQAGWDGVFTWDGIHISDEIAVYDPWGAAGGVRGGYATCPARRDRHAAGSPAAMESGPRSGHPV